MKTKIKIQIIPDPNTNIPISTPEDHIADIKKEIQCPVAEICATPVFDMWKEK